MLSYRHAFHAGNHADLLKHVVLVQLLDYMGQKEKSYSYIDTHAGAGAYALDEGYAQKNAEFESGIARLWGRRDLPPALVEYVDEVRVLNPDGQLRYYPGSPYLAWQLMREQDRARLFELHTTEITTLRHNFREAGKRVMIDGTDGFDALKAVLPPPSRRAVVLIDPSYEDKKDYGRTLTALTDAIKRFSTGTYAVWYPIVSRPQAKRFPEQLKALQPRNWLHVTLTVSAPPVDGLGLYGSGVFILNPPYLLAETLQQTLPYLVKTLGQDAHAGFVMEHRGD
jgi:23S rRNA (adenine2030-N6)-methyltransferase